MKDRLRSISPSEKADTPDSLQSTSHSIVINSITRSQRDLTRLRAFLTPGVVSGQIGNLDFDKRDSLGYPTRIALKPNHEVTVKIPTKLP